MINPATSDNSYVDKLSCGTVWQSRQPLVFLSVQPPPLLVHLILSLLSPLFALVCHLIPYFNPLFILTVPTFSKIQENTIMSRNRRSAGAVRGPSSALTSFLAVSLLFKVARVQLMTSPCRVLVWNHLVV